jgi:hypothetical protein
MNELTSCCVDQLHINADISKGIICDLMYILMIYALKMTHMSCTFFRYLKNVIQAILHSTRDNCPALCSIPISHKYVSLT